MNGQQIMNTAITYSTDELDSIKSQMAAVLDGMALAIAPAKSKGTSESDLKAMADTAIRSNMRRILSGKTDYMVERDGRTAIIGISQITTNAIVDLFNSQI